MIFSTECNSVKHCLQFDYDIDNTSSNLDSVRFGKGLVFG